MSLASMLVVLVVVIAIVPFALRILGVTSIAGFQDSVEAVPQQAAARSDSYTPDSNTRYICRSPNESGVPCPEGQFCDGTRQVCEQKTVPGMGEVVGYFS
jgi:hypothetical protein